MTDSSRQYRSGRQESTGFEHSADFIIVHLGQENKSKIARCQFSPSDSRSDPQAGKKPDASIELFSKEEKFNQKRSNQ